LIGVFQKARDRPLVIAQFLDVAEFEAGATLDADLAQALEFLLAV